MVGIAGAARVEGVRVRKAQGVERFIECDTVVFTGDWVPDHELARRAGLELTRETKSPAVSGVGETSRSGIYAIETLCCQSRLRTSARLMGVHLHASSSKIFDGFMLRARTGSGLIVHGWGYNLLQLWWRTVFVALGACGGWKA